jgi:two-component sensor histidine kinase
MATFLQRGKTADQRVAHPNLRVAQFYLDTQRRVIQCLNETARQFVREGIPVTGEALQRQPLTTLTGVVVQPEDFPLYRAWCEGSAQEATFVMAQAGQSVQHLVWSAAPVRDPQGELQGIAGTLVVTPPEPDWLTLAGLAHDLRSPLQVLKLLVPLLEAFPPMHPEAGRALGQVRSASERAMSLALELLEWCRHPLLGARPVERNWVALGSLLESLGREHLPGAKRKGVPLHIDIEPARPLEAHTDGTRLSRLVANLLGNAIRYTSAGQVRLSAAWREEKGSPRVLVVGIHDTGVGLAEEDHDSIFQAFGRGKAGKESDSAGSGIGLAVVDQLVQELGLVLQVYSQQGEGSTFELLLPVTILRPMN